MIKSKEDLPKNILVSKGDKIIPISISNIAVIKLQHGVVHVHTLQSSQYIFGENLDGINKRLDNQFFRLNRQVIINRKAISEVSKYFTRRLLIKPSIALDMQLIVSKTIAPDFLSWLESV